MTLRNFANTATIGLAPLLVGAAGYLLSAGDYAAALAALVCVVLCMELRVRVGWRLPRSKYFVLHIVGGALLLAALAALAWWQTPAWLVALAWLLLAAVALGGGAKLVEQYATLP